MSEMFRSTISRVSTPDGTMFVIVAENNDGEPNHVTINIGKAGHALAAWAFALSAVITLGLQNGIKLEAFLTILSSITSDGNARALGSKCRSGPEGVWMALMMYRKAKFEDLEKVLGGDSDSEEEEGYGASIRS